VGRDAGKPDLSLFLEPAQLVQRLLGEVFGLGDAQEQEDVDIIGAEYFSRSRLRTSRMTASICLSMPKQKKKFRPLSIAL
jgi:hypothetical protein